MRAASPEHPYGRPWNSPGIQEKSLDFHGTQQYCGVMIPEFVDIGAAWRVLPPGIHEANLREVGQRFATNDHRGLLFDGFRRALKTLRKAGCRSVFLDGSFVSEKAEPGDYDVCWDTSGVQDSQLDPVFLDFSHGRKAQKDKYGGEFFPANDLADGSSVFLHYFQTDRDTGRPKGIVLIRSSGRARKGAAT